MSPAQTILLGALAGGTIFLGLPMGRMRRLSSSTTAFLNAIAIGILVFLLLDVFPHASGPVETALDAARHGTGSWGRFIGLFALAVGGFAIGLLGLVAYDMACTRRRSREPVSLSAAVALPVATHHRTKGQRTAFFIAVGIGLHNFAEGLAIGQSAASGELRLAVLLVIGFALHNATEGFGIVAPMSTDEVMPSWTFLLGLGAIGGGPTLVGSILGRTVTNDFIAVGALVLAAGSILYVVIQLLMMATRLGHHERLYFGVFVGLIGAFVTELIVAAAGA